MKTFTYGNQPLSPGAKALKAKLEGHTVFKRNMTVMDRVKDGSASDSDRAQYRELMRPFREGRQDVVRG